MIIELLLARGTQIIIDGKRPDDIDPRLGWSTGDDEYGGMTTGTYESGVLNMKHIPLPIAGLQLEGFHFDRTLDSIWNCDGDPKTLTLRLAGGDKITAKVTDIASDPNETGEVVRTLTTGEEKQIDECTLYIRAET